MNKSKFLIDFWNLNNITMKCSPSYSDSDNDKEKQFDIVSSPEIEEQCEIKPEVFLECRVCGGPAHGYNFDQISCESCKAFFRRNALRYMPDLRCRYDGSCNITVESRRQCTYCRLKKCFDVKMRKEWIRTEEERHLRKLKRLYKQQKKMNQIYNISIIERKKNRPDLLPILSTQLIQYKQPMFSMDKNVYSSNLTVDDWSLINNISHSYDIWALDNETNPINNYSLNNSLLKDFLNDEHQVYSNLIQFFKQIPHFKQIDVEDQVLLIKCNITHLVHIHHVLKDHFEENPQIGLYMSKWINEDFHKQMSKTRHSLNYFIRHPIILKISLVVFIFIINLSRLPYEQLSFEFIDKNLLIENQNIFITLLWKYLNVIYNENDAIKATQCIVFQFLRYQLLMNEMETIINKQYHPDQFHPLTKSVLRLT